MTDRAPLQVRCRFKRNLQQKDTVLDGSVAGVATVAGYLTCLHEKKKEERREETRRKKFQKPATPATPATEPTGTPKTRCKFPPQVATNLQHTQVTPCP
jgi:hypothetical protein